MNSEIRKEVSIQELKDELEGMLIGYQREMETHKMKVERGVLELILKDPLETAERFVKFKWSQLADPLFYVSKQKIQLLEEERKSKNNAVAYIFSSTQKFTA